MDRLLFSYALPILDYASSAPSAGGDGSETEFSSTSVFNLPPQQRMSEGSYTPSFHRLYESQSSLSSSSSSQSRHPFFRFVALPPLLRTILISQRSLLLKSGALRLLNTIVQITPSLIMHEILLSVSALSSSSSPNKQSVSPAGLLSRPFLFALLLLFSLSARTYFENHYFHYATKVMFLTRGGVGSLIFDKGLYRSTKSQAQQQQQQQQQLLLLRDQPPSSSSETSTATTTTTTSSSSSSSSSSFSSSTHKVDPLTLMNHDIALIESLVYQIHVLWDAPLQIAVYTYLLYRLLGGSTVFFTILVMGMSIPVNYVIMRRVTYWSLLEAKQAESRTSLLRSSLSCMKSLLLTGLSPPTVKRLLSIRGTEMSIRHRSGLLRALNTAFGGSAAALVLLAVMSSGTSGGNNKNVITASVAFSAISLLQQLRYPLLFYPMLMSSISEAWVAIKRVDDYLQEDGVGVGVTAATNEGPSSGGGVSQPTLSYVKPIVSATSTSIVVENGSFDWPATGTHNNKKSPALIDVNLKVDAGEIVAVVGGVGTGKSALLKAILGEMMLDESWSNGVVKVTGKDPFFPGYFAQDPWLFRGTIKDNIVFGREIDEALYEEVVRASGLDDDFRPPRRGGLLPAASISSYTEVTEGGQSLSGGQRARVALARALYGRSSALLLDDPLASLDAPVRRKIFEALKAAVRRDKIAAVIVTSDPAVVIGSDRIVVMGKQGGDSAAEEGCYSGSGGGGGGGVGDGMINTIVDVGTFTELLSRGHNLLGYMQSQKRGVEKAGAHNIAETASGVGGGGGGGGGGGVSPPPSPLCESPAAASSLMECNPPADEIPTEPLPPSDADGQKPKTSTLDDKMSTGAVPWSAYVSYFKAIRSTPLVVVALLSYFTANAAQIMQQLVVAKWTDTSTQATSPQLRTKYLLLMTCAAVAVFAGHFLKFYFTLLVSVRASTTLHNQMLKSVFSAPMSFFDAVPSGQLMTRFGRELSIIDRNLPEAYGWVVVCFFQIFLACSTIVAGVSPVMLIPMALLGLFYGRIVSKFRPASRGLKRYDSKCKSPIITQFSEALRGVEIIRSIKGARERWSTSHRVLSDGGISANHSLKLIDRWLAVRLEATGNLLVFMVALVSTHLAKTGRLTAGAAGWGLTQALSVCGLLNWAVRVVTDTETHMHSVQRVNELCNPNIVPRELGEAGEAFRRSGATTEAVLSCPKSDEALLESGWPWEGRVEFKNVSVRYNDKSPQVLKGVNLDIKPGSAVGIVGRTGSGKSSLLLSLFRIIELDGDVDDSGVAAAAAAGGGGGGGGVGSSNSSSSSSSSNQEIMPQILIDGVDIRSVRLQSLRERLSIIPQEPFLMQGTLRYNLSPGAEADGKPVSEEEDARLWRALYTVSPLLTTKFRHYHEGLDTIIPEQGKGLSTGERQLICLTRALLKRSKIVVLDECSSSMDVLTDKSVHDIIHSEFTGKGVTVISVAHRLAPLLDFDDIVVLDSGKVLEQAPPLDNSAFLALLHDKER